MSELKMREEFEAWAIADAAECGMDLEFQFEAEAGWYLGKSGKHMNLAWSAWQASREALVIALPREVSLRSSAEVRDMIKHHIESLGLKVSQ